MDDKAGFRHNQEAGEGGTDGSRRMSDTDDERDDEAKEPTKANPKADRTDRLADALERVAFKIHDFGNWLMGFLR